MFFGTISPSTMCSAVTIPSAIASAMGWTSPWGTPTAANGPSSRCATAGSPTAPRPTEHTVIPSCAQAIIKETSSMARNVIRAAPEPPAANGSTWVRRAEMSENSAPTKKAFPIRSTRAMPMAAKSPIRLPLLWAESDPRDPTVFDRQHLELDAHRYRDVVGVQLSLVRGVDEDGVADLWKPSEVLGDQPGHGLGVHRLRQPERRGGGDLVRAQ